MVYVVMEGNLYGHIYIKDCNVRKAFEIASPKHTEGLIRSIEGIMQVMKYQMVHMTL